MKSGKFYFCDKSKTMVYAISDGGQPLTCCGEPMRLLEANTTEAATEKHIPKVEREDGKLVITIGETKHPMLEEHFIEWIAVVNDTRAKIFKLKPGDDPVITTCAVDDGEVYEYCNIHGLWKTDI